MTRSHPKHTAEDVHGAAVTGAWWTIIPMVLIVLPSSGLQAQVDRRSELGVLVGDPVALCLEVPTQRSSSLNVHGGIWTWGLWHDIAYNTPYLSIDHVWYLPVGHSSRRFYLGGGFAIFFRDNPKDTRDYDAAVGVRLPLGVTFYTKDGFSIGFELAPFYQVAPQFSFTPYIIDLNGGLLLSWAL